MSKHIHLLTALIIFSFSSFIIFMKELMAAETGTGNGYPIVIHDQAIKNPGITPRIVVPDTIYANEPARFLDLTREASGWMWEIPLAGKKSISRVFRTTFEKPGEYALTLHVRGNAGSGDTVFFINVLPARQPQSPAPYMSDKQFAMVFKEISNGLIKNGYCDERDWNNKVVSQCGKGRNMYVQVVNENDKSETVTLKSYRQKLADAEYETIRYIEDISRNANDGSISIISVFAIKNAVSASL